MQKRWFLVSLGNVIKSVQSYLHIVFYIKLESNTNYAFKTEPGYNILQYALDNVSSIQNASFDIYG